MKLSRCHKNYRDRLSHYLCPLHLFAPMVKFGLKTRSKIIRSILFNLIKGYDTVYRVIFITP